MSFKHTSEDNLKKEINEIEYEMRCLFSYRYVNDAIVAKYNALERRWKKLTSCNN